ncbi:anthranilate phosphoribosyltransferase [Enemella sp. A6]|uniref:anthranilate phosphoribosyltransferase n=1 Tax=Enemella sp. A6 TaxID=3440152 RepID=UPI003EB96324
MTEATFTWPAVLTSLVNRQDLSSEQVEWAMGQILTGQASPIQIAGFAVALRAKGETVAEISGLATAMLDHAELVHVTGRTVDVVGSGGDRANTVNISTMSALVAASGGARVAKHGNRAASSMCGTADVLEELGVKLDLEPQQQQQVMDEAGIVFLFASRYHPSLRHAAGPRRELGISTTFNFLGPLSNPARPQGQAIGVADRRMAELMAGVLADRGTRGLVFHGDDGLDELTTTTTSDVWVVADGAVRHEVLDPLELGIERARVEDLIGGPPPVNAEIARAVLAGAPGPVHDIVALNAAATLLADRGPSDAPLREQLAVELDRARELLADGGALQVLERWVAVSNRV